MSKLVKDIPVGRNVSASLDTINSNFTSLETAVNAAASKFDGNSLSVATLVANSNNPSVATTTTTITTNGTIATLGNIVANGAVTTPIVNTTKVLCAGNMTVSGETNVLTVEGSISVAGNLIYPDLTTTILAQQLPDSGTFLVDSEEKQMVNLQTGRWTAATVSFIGSTVDVLELSDGTEGQILELFFLTDQGHSKYIKFTDIFDVAYGEGSLEITNLMSMKIAYFGNSWKILNIFRPTLTLV